MPLAFSVLESQGAKSYQDLEEDETLPVEEKGTKKNLQRSFKLTKSTMIDD